MRAAKLSDPPHAQAQAPHPPIQYRRAAEAIHHHHNNNNNNNNQHAPQQHTTSAVMSGRRSSNNNNDTTTNDNYNDNDSHRNSHNNSSSHHRVVAHPMDPIQTSSLQPQPPPPTLYDTSVSSAANNSAEDGRSTGSKSTKSGNGGGGYSPYYYHHRSRPSHPPPPSTTTTTTTNATANQPPPQPQFRAVPSSSMRQSPKTTSTSSSSCSSSHRNSRWTSPNDILMSPPPSNVAADPSSSTSGYYVTQSEPGGGSVEQDRFAAYINRFAELDPRMDHRYSTTPEETTNVNTTATNTNNHNHNHNTTNSTTDSVYNNNNNTRQQLIEEEESHMQQQKHKFRTRAVYSQQQQVASSRSHEEALSAPSVRKQRGQGHQQQYMYHQQQPSETVSEIGTNGSPSNRTRDLARRIEQHMGRKQQLQQNRESFVAVVDDEEALLNVNPKVSFDEPISNSIAIAIATTPTNKSIPQPHHYYPQRQLGATYVPIPKPIRFGVVDEEGEGATYQRPTHRTGTTTTSSSRKIPINDESVPTLPANEKRVSPKKASPQQQNDGMSRRIDISNAPTYPDWTTTTTNGRNVAAIAIPPVSTPSHNNQPSSQRINQVLVHVRQHQQSQQEQHQQQQLTQDMHHTTTELETTTVMREHHTRRSIGGQVQHQQQPQQQAYEVLAEPRQSHPQEQHATVQHGSRRQQQQPRSRSLGPPQRRRQQPPLQESTPIVERSSSNDKCVESNVDHTHNKTNTTGSHHEPLIRRVGTRAEIETPLPTNVRELRRMLWTDDELLQVKVRSSYRDTGNNSGNYYGQRTHIDGPEMAGTSGQRNARSLSPKTHRLRSKNEDDIHPHGVSAREHKGMLFKSRYYEAALRGEMSVSPKRGLLVTTEDDTIDHRTRPLTESLDATTQLKEQQSTSPSDIRPGRIIDIDTTQAIQKDVTSAVGRPRNMEYIKNIETADEAMEGDIALSLLRKINQVNKDDPKAALEEINALLNQQRQISEEMQPRSVPKSNVQAIDETTSVPGVEPALTMQDNESDDESDGTSVSSMTNPTFQEISTNKISAPISPSSGRPRPSVLGSYNSPSQKAHSTNRQLTENRIPNSLKEPKSPTVSNQCAHDGGVGKANADLQPSANDETTLEASGNLDSDKAYAVDKKSTPSLLSQLGSFISPRRNEEPTSSSKEIAEKIKIWDDLSTGAIPVGGKSPSVKDKTSDVNVVAEKHHPKRDVKVSDHRDMSPGSALKRDHPWDGAIPVRMGQINVKDTSMDCGDGIEAEFTPKYAKAHTSPDSTRESPEQKKMTRGDVTDSVLKKPLDVARPNKVVEHQNEAPKFISNQQQKAKAMSDDFDSTWVSLPSSTFFGSKPGRVQSNHLNRNIGGASNQRPNMADYDQAELLRAENETRSPSMALAKEDESTDGAVYSPIDDVEVEYVRDTTRIRSTEMQTITPKESNTSPPNNSYAQLKSPKREVYARHRKSSTFDDSYETPKQNVVNTSRSFETAPMTGKEPKPRSRGLRGFLKRKQAEKASTGNSIDRTAASIASSRRSNAVPTTTRALGDLADIEASPSNNTTNYSELVKRYARRSAKSRSPSRNRSRSADERRTIRNPSLAMKFNRLLRVHDDTELIEF